MIAVPAPSQSALAAALLDPGLPCPAGLRAWNGSDASRRFAVHRNNVVASLVDALAETFPVVQALVGQEFFRAMASVFVRQQPPRSPLLHEYGDALPGFVEGFAPAASVSYLADVARLEWARVEACHVADVAPLAASDAASAASAERAGELLLTLHPAVRIVSSPHAIVSIWAAHQGEGELEQVDPDCGEHALVVRSDFEVLVVRCDAGTAAFVRSLQQGRNLADSAGAAAAAAEFDPVASLSLLIAHGALAAIALPEESP